jgi:uncharacterized protein (DUF1697 family)
MVADAWTRIGRRAARGPTIKARLRTTSDLGRIRGVATYIAFLRAINLGAKRKFPKGAIVAAVEATGFTDVATYINTGNVRFDTTLRSRARIEAALEKGFEAAAGFEVPTIVFTQQELRKIAEEAATFGHGGKHYVSLLKEAPSAASIKRLEDSITTDEVARVGGRAVHLLLGENYHEARLTNAAVERHLGVATNRNLTVIKALAEKWC